MRIMLPILLLALSADAGIVYRFTTESTAALHASIRGRVWMDGDRKRVELDPDPANPRTFDVAITANGKTTFINLMNKTYFDEQKDSDDAVSGGSSALFHLPWPDDRIKGRPKITYTSAGPGPSAGEYATARHIIKFAYRVKGDFQGVSLQGDVEATVSTLTAPALPRDAEGLLVRTGFMQVDDELARLLNAPAGMIVAYEVSVSRRLEGGPVVTEKTTTSIEDLAIRDIDESIFVIPTGLTYRQPVYGIPGH